MAQKQKLKDAPITEAVVDIRFSPAVADDRLGHISELISLHFPKKQNIWQNEFGFAIDPDGKPTSQHQDQKLLGIRFDSKDGKHVVQCRTNGYTFSWLKPYSEWKDLRQEAKKYWELCYGDMQGAIVTRLAVRYINNLDFRLPFKDFNEYLETSPFIPEKLPQGVASFLQKIVIVNPEKQCSAIVHQVYEGNTQDDSNSIKVQLDIDIPKNVRMLPDDPAIWSELDSLRDFKNDVFFEYLTEKALEPYK